MELHVPLQLLLTFFLVLSRISGLVMISPVFSSTSVPVRIRAFLAISLSVLVTPLQAQATLESTTSLLQLAPLFAGEILLGLLMGFGVRLVFLGVQLTGQIIGHMSGMQLSEVFDPTSDANIPVFSQLLDMTMLAVFLAIGGHRRLVAAVLDSFQQVPLGNAAMRTEAATELQVVMQASFHLGLQVAAPAMIALLSATLILGFVSRTLPQINAVQVGFNLNAIVVFAVLFLSLGAAINLFWNQLEWLFDRFDALPFGAGEVEPGSEPVT